jgi:hypothetical protein
MQAVDVHFLVDNQLLVNFINGPDSSNPLDWRITPYTSTDKKFLAGSNSTQPQNSTPTKMADLLAKQSFYMIQATQLDLQDYVLILLILINALLLWHFTTYSYRCNSSNSFLLLINESYVCCKKTHLD